MKFTIKEDSKDEDGDKSVNSQFASSKSSRDVEAMRKSTVPKKIKRNMDWSERRTWCSWAAHCLKNMSQEELENCHELDTNLASMSTESMNYWLEKFLLEVRTVNSINYVVSCTKV